MASLTVTSKILLSMLPMAIIESEEAEDFCKEKKGGKCQRNDDNNWSSFLKDFFS